MSLRSVNGDVVLSGTFAAGTHVSTPVALPSAASDVLVMTHITAVGAGTAPTFTVTVEESADGTTWAAVAGSAGPALAGAGNSTSNARVTQRYVRVSAVAAIASFTGRVAILAFAD